MYRFVSRVNFYRMAVWLMPVALGGVVGVGLGLGGLDRVMYTVSEMMSARKPILPPPSVICINSYLYNIW